MHLINKECTVLQGGCGAALWGWEGWVRWSPGVAGRAVQGLLVKQGMMRAWEGAMGPGWGEGCVWPGSGSRLLGLNLGSHPCSCTPLASVSSSVKWRQKSTPGTIGLLQLLHLWRSAPNVKHSKRSGSIIPYCLSQELCVVSAVGRARGWG